MDFAAAEKTHHKYESSIDFERFTLDTEIYVLLTDLAFHEGTDRGEYLNKVCNMVDYVTFVYLDRQRQDLAQDHLLL